MQARIAHREQKSIGDESNEPLLPAQRSFAVVEVRNVRHRTVFGVPRRAVMS
jgi:hypothetical protein